MVNKLKKINPDFGIILKSLCDLSASGGFKIYLVGGVVRDLLLDKDIFDLDIVVEGDAIALAQKFAQMHNKEFKRHHAFGTATVYFDKHHLDFATARRETYAVWGALPKVVSATLKEDLLRRDFTINAMAISLNKEDYGKLIDYYKGLADLRRGLIRILYRDSFLDDPTRILRAIRFEQRFYFRIEKETLCLLNKAIERKALSLVNPHRLREEMISILKEDRPLRYIRRMNELRTLAFIHKNFKLTHNDFKNLSSIERTIRYYHKKFKKHRKVEQWIIYLSVLLMKLKVSGILEFLENFGLKRGERLRILSARKNIHKMKRLNSNLKRHMVYRLLNPLSFESILFFYAYYPQRKIRKNIELFLEELVGVRIQTKGEELKALGFSPQSIYGRILEKLLYLKIDKGLKTMDEELKQAKLIFERVYKK